MSIRVGVDIGGTFTDFCVYDDATGVMQTFKTFSTPTTPGAEVMNGVAELERRFGHPPADISYFTHGTTVGVNTVIQRRGAALALSLAPLLKPRLLVRKQSLWRCCTLMPIRRMNGLRAMRSWLPHLK